MCDLQYADFVISKMLVIINKPTIIFTV